MVTPIRFGAIYRLKGEPARLCYSVQQAHKSFPNSRPNAAVARDVTGDPTIVVAPELYKVRASMYGRPLGSDYVIVTNHRSRDLDAFPDELKYNPFAKGSKANNDAFIAWIAARRGQGATVTEIDTLPNS